MPLPRNDLISTMPTEATVSKIPINFTSTSMPPNFNCSVELPLNRERRLTKLRASAAPREKPNTYRMILLTLLVFFLFFLDFSIVSLKYLFRYSGKVSTSFSTFSVRSLLFHGIIFLISSFSIIME